MLSADDAARLTEAPLWLMNGRELAERGFKVFLFSMNYSKGLIVLLELLPDCWFWSFDGWRTLLVTFRVTFSTVCTALIFSAKLLPNKQSSIRTESDTVLAKKIQWGNNEGPSRLELTKWRSANRRKPSAIFVKAVLPSSDICNHSSLESFDIPKPNAFREAPSWAWDCIWCLSWAIIVA